MRLNLVRLTFDPYRDTTIRIIGNPYELHQFIYEIMSANEDPGRLLYRLEAGDSLRNPVPCLLIQTERPVVSRINDRRWGQLDFVRMETKSSTVALQEGGIYRFRLRANPVRSERAKLDGRRGKRMGIVQPDAQIEWLAKRLSNSGMRLINVDHRREPWLEVRSKPKKHQKTARCRVFASAFFEGALKVIGAEPAEQSIIKGIGPGKAFGFGLLSLARR